MTPTPAPPATAGRPDTLAAIADAIEKDADVTMTPRRRSAAREYVRRLRALPQPPPLDAGVVERLKVAGHDLRTAVVGGVRLLRPRGFHTEIAEAAVDAWDAVLAHLGAAPAEPAKAEAAKPLTNRELLATLPVGTVARRQWWCRTTAEKRHDGWWEGEERNIRSQIGDYLLDEPTDGPHGIVVVSRPDAAPEPPPAPTFADMLSELLGHKAGCKCERCKAVPEPAAPPVPAPDAAPPFPALDAASRHTTRCPVCGLCNRPECRRHTGAEKCQCKPAPNSPESPEGSAAGLSVVLSALAAEFDALKQRGVDQQRFEEAAAFLRARDRLTVAARAAK